MASTHPIIQAVNIEDEETGEAFVVLDFPRVGGRKGRVTVPRGHLLDPAKLRAKLVDHNADIALLVKNPRDVTSAIASTPRAHASYAARIGWHRSGAFVTTVGAISAYRLDRCLLPPRERITEVAPRRGRRGSLAGWKREVGRRCRWSKVGTLVLCAAFAAPLVKLSGRPSFGLNLFGPSKMGKSAMLLAGASVSGAGHEQELPNWGASESSVGELCRLYNDDLLPLNEVGLMQGSKAQVFERIRQTIFQIAEGRERQRHSASVYATNSRKARFSTIFVSTAEHAFSNYARSAKVERDAGEFARCAEIGIARSDSESIFDVYPPKLRRAGRRAWSATQLGRLRRGCAENHGVPLVAFIGYLQEDLSAAKEDIVRFSGEFRRSLRDLDLSDVHWHRADNFALLYAAGRMATDAGILDYDKGRLLHWVRELLLVSIGDEQDAVRQIGNLVGRLRTHLHGPCIADKRAQPATIRPERYDGYRTVDGAVTINAAKFRRLFEDEPGADRRVLRWLRDRRLLQLARRRSSHEALDRTIKWPYGRGVRCFVISARFLA